MKRILPLALGAMAFAGAAQAADVTVYTTTDPVNTLKSVTFANGKTIDFTIGFGSGAFRHPADPDNMIYAVSDRGPNFTCKQAKKVIGPESQDVCTKIKKSRYYPVPEYSPSLYHLMLNDDMTFSVKDVIAFKTASGKPINGLLNPLTVASTEQPIDAEGKPLPHSQDAIDAEGIIKLSDGTFWVGEEMGPSILHVAADGRILMRIVPKGTEKDFAKADTVIVGGLPAILAKRQANRGIESMAVSPCEKFLYFIVQNPLANPDKKAYTQAKNARLFKMDRSTLRIIGEYVYQLDDPQSFALDPSDKQNAPRISELTALGYDRLLVLERTNGTTKLHEITLEGATNILGSAWDDLATAPSLEQSNDLSGTDITPVEKTLRFDTATDAKDAPTKIEGVAFLKDGSMVLINDNDFGIKGDATKILVVKGTDIKADKH